MDLFQHLSNNPRGLDGRREWKPSRTIEMAKVFAIRSRPETARWLMNWRVCFMDLFQRDVPNETACIGILPELPFSLQIKTSQLLQSVPGDEAQKHGQLVVLILGFVPASFKQPPWPGRAP